MTLHADIMNLPQTPPADIARSVVSPSWNGYQIGHRDARHAAAELALKADAEAEALRKDAARYRWLRDRLLAADFDYNGEGVQALVFELPNGCSVSADCDATIDAAMLAAREVTP